MILLEAAGIILTEMFLLNIIGTFLEYVVPIGTVPIFSTSSIVLSYFEADLADLACGDQPYGSQIISRVQN